MRSVYTPSELNREARIHLEAGFGSIWVEGEISNLARPASGHLYFSIKDARSQLRCALFRSSARGLGFRPENGQLVQVRGRLSLYEPRGDYQLIADSLEPAGEGKLRAAYEALKSKLEQEGLFSASRKKPLPPSPQRIAVITSPSGAVIRDIINVLSRRWPLARVRLYPVPVQGSAAAPAIVQALQAANEHAWAEALIVGRGGGSLEDLQAFNDETVARAIAASNIPVLSAVGHETDVSISDFVADERAPTPSAAAEILSLDSAVVRQHFVRQENALAQRMQRILLQHSQRADQLTGRLQAQHPTRRISNGTATLKALGLRLQLSASRQISSRQQQLDQLQQRLRNALPARLADKRQVLNGLVRTLHAVSPLPTMLRGYSVTTDASTGQTITSWAQLEEGQTIKTTLADGQATSKVIRTKPDGLEAGNSGDE